MLLAWGVNFSMFSASFAFLRNGTAGEPFNNFIPIYHNMGMLDFLFRIFRSFRVSAAQKAPTIVGAPLALF